MAISDQEIQALQGEIKRQASSSNGHVFKTSTGNYYRIVHSIDSTTQAIVVAPIKYDTNGKEYVDYSETAIAVAGTQPIANDSVLNSM